MEKFMSFWGIAVLILLLVGAAMVLGNPGGAVALGGTGFTGVNSILNNFLGGKGVAAPAGSKVAYSQSGGVTVG